MRFCRFALSDGSPRYGIVEGQAVVEVEGDIFERYGATSQIHPIAEIELLAPVNPSKIVALGTNFSLHAKEMGREVPDEPKIFLKPPSALIGHQAPIVLPKVPGQIDHEAEVALIVKRVAKNVPADQALDYVMGYTCFNDISARALQKKDGVFARAKGFDTFAPAGPWLQTDLVWEKLEVEGWVNGERRQHGALSDLVFGVPEVMAFVSRVMTLLPGDMIALGTPLGVGPLEDGDRVQVIINGVGTLENPVVQE
ncbi:MAG: fumarylacetoacetate hydrolase family protein [Deltaproteobacteria bacterium]|nr:fumarylacetoacetate hydrolase family protein [Deltaproteobacteria bacterium]